MTSHPLPDYPLLLDACLPRLTSFLITKAEKRVSNPWWPIGRSIRSCEDPPLPESREPLGQVSFLTSRHKLGEVWLVSGTLAWVVDEHPDSRTGLRIGSINCRLPSTYSCIPSHIPLGSLHCPSSTSSAPSQSQVSSSVRPVTPLRFFLNFAFLLLYILGAGSHLHQTRTRRSPKEFVSIFCIAQLTTLISAAATAQTNLVILTHILIARHHCPISFRWDSHRNSTHSLHLPEEEY